MTVSCTDADIVMAHNDMI